MNEKEAAEQIARLAELFNKKSKPRKRRRIKMASALSQGRIASFSENFARKKKKWTI